jgi:hypothetical protein
MRALLTVALTSGLAASALAARGQGDIGNRELADYRLTLPAFERFLQASHLIVDVTRADARFKDAPLFTEEVAVYGDAAMTATALAVRLENDAGLAAALRTAKMTPREYAVFAITLFAARMAHGFVGAGVLRGVPPGTPTDNIAFVDAHRLRIGGLLKEMGVLKD